MTYEQAVSTAFLTVLHEHRPQPDGCWGSFIMKTNFAERTYALRRLRVRAGLTP